MIFSGSELEHRRKAACLSRHDVVVEFVRRGGDPVTERTLSRWEAGRNEPRATTLAALANILECEITDFYSTEAA